MVPELRHSNAESDIAVLEEVFPPTLKGTALTS